MSTTRISFSTMVMMWSMIPFGLDDLVLCFEERNDRIQFRRRRFFCPFGKAKEETILFDDIRRVFVTQYRPICPQNLCRSILEPIVNIGVAFIAGFLLHVIVASYYTVTSSLGSSSTHRELGLWWGLLGLAWYVWATCIARQPRVVIESNTTTTTCALYLSDGDTAKRVVDAITSKSAKPHFDVVSGLSRTSPTKQALPFLSILFMLIANAAIVFGIFVQKCSDCGGCSDDGPPRDGCYYDNDPEVPLGVVVLFSCVCLIAWWLWMRYVKKVHVPSALVVEESKIPLTPASSTSSSKPADHGAVILTTV